MPARKSNASVMSMEEGASSSQAQGLSVEDLNLPKTMVNRLAKGVLPANTNLQSVAQAAISKSATVFVNYLTAHASDIAARQSKKTIQPKDVLDALKELEFEQFVPRVEGELQRYNTIQCDKRNTYRRKVKEEKRAAEAAANGLPLPAGATSPGANGTILGHAEDGEPAAKKARRDLDDSAMDEDGDEPMDEEQDQEDEGEGEDENEDGEDENEDEEEEEHDEDREDPIEEKEEREEQDDVLDGDESD